ncbi:sterigmatocystin 8-O-methyltransferase [Colletotrichum tofieldiae]|nr:sterigmatocystin 8-O-methyltransferase [Colletotrichum tofieldiae]
MSSGTNAANVMNGEPTHGHEYLCAVKDVTASSFMSEKDRVEALQATYEAIARLESPWDTYVRLQMNMSGVAAGLKIIKDLRLMAKWHEKGCVPMTSSQLAELVGNCDPQLLLTQSVVVPSTLCPNT